MRRFTITHELHGTQDAFWSAYFDEATTRRLFETELGFGDLRVLERTERDDELRRRLSVRPQLDLPGPLQKLLGAFSYEEDGRLDRRASTYRFRYIPTVLTDRIRCDGQLRVTAVGTDRIRWDVEMEIGAKVLGLGGLLESTAELQMRAAWKRSSAFFDRLLRATPPAG
jgi:hypothetical protein